MMAVACVVSLSATCLSQTAPAFTFETSTGGPTPSQLYAVDVNNDGLSDIIQISSTPNGTTGTFTISINNGNGTFKAPVTYNLHGLAGAMTWGDFNNDGNVDIAVVILQTNQVAVYLGNGDGTFRAPVTSTIDLPTGITFTSPPTSSIVAADFDHDGKMDLVVPAANLDQNTGWSVYLLLGDGTGHLTSPTAIYYPTSGWMVQTIVGGDFDTDGNADVTVLESMYCSDGYNQCYSNAVALFGEGNTNFDSVDVTTFDGGMTLGSADLNNDGATDLYGIERSTDGSVNRLAVFTGHYGRDFSYLYTPVSNPNVYAPIAVANFDGNWDLAALVSTYSTNGGASYQMMYFLDPGFASGTTIAYGPSPGGSATYQMGLVAGNFNGDLQPDIAVNTSTAAAPGASQYSPTTTLAVGLNNTPSGFYGLCNYPSSGQGIHLCSPSTQTTPGQAEVEASANSFGMLRKIELWINGQKQGEQNLVWGGRGYFDWYLPNLTAGTYNATLFAANIDNTLQQYNFTITVGNTCGPPPQRAYGVNVCTPVPGGTYNDPMQVTATAKITGTLARMEVWVDGVKKFTETNSTTLNTTLTLSQGYHELNIFAVNTLGKEWETAVDANAMQQ
jgi:hypothetical protein